MERTGKDDGVMYDTVAKQVRLPEITHLKMPSTWFGLVS